MSCISTLGRDCLERYAMNIPILARFMQDNLLLLFRRGARVHLRGFHAKAERLAFASLPASPGTRWRLCANITPRLPCGALHAGHAAGGLFSVRTLSSAWRTLTAFCAVKGRCQLFYTGVAGIYSL